MSAFTVGTQVSRMTDGPEKEPVSQTPPDENAAKVFVKWIPGDAVVFYTAILALGAQQIALPEHPTPEQELAHVDAGSAGWFAFALLTCAIFVIIGAYGGGGDATTEKKTSLPSLIVRIVLTLIAFTLWTTLLPGAWAYNWYFVKDMGPLYGAVILVVASAFTFIAERLTGKNSKF